MPPIGAGRIADPGFVCGFPLTLINLPPRRVSLPDDLVQMRRVHSRFLKLLKRSPAAHPSIPEYNRSLGLFRLRACFIRRWGLPVTK